MLIDAEYDKIFLAFVKSKCLLSCSKKAPQAIQSKAVISILITTFHVSLDRLRDQLLVNALNNTRYAFLIPPVCATCMFVSTHIHIYIYTFILLTAKIKLSLKLISSKTRKPLDFKCRVACIFNLSI